MSLSRVLILAAVAVVIVFAISFLHGAARYKRQTYWLSRMWGQFHVVQGLGTKHPVMSEPVGGGAPGRYAATAVGDDLVIVHETEIPRRSESEPRASIRYYLFLSKNDFGGWDLRATTTTTAELDKHPDVDETAKKLAESAPNETIVHDYLLPVRDAYALEAARAAMRRSSGWEMLLADELEKTPDDVALRLVEVDAALVEGNAAGVRERTAELRKLPDAATRPLVASAAKNYDEWLAAQGGEGRANAALAFGRLSALGSSIDADDIDELRDAFAALPDDATYRPVSTWLAVKSLPRSVNPAAARAVALAFRTKSNDEPDAAGAIEWLAPLHRAAIAMARDSSDQMDVVASIAVREETSEGMGELLARSGTDAAAALAILAQLDAVSDLENSAGEPRALANVPVEESREALAAYRVPAARIGLARIVATARSQAAVPTSVDALSDLLGGRIGTDPFAGGSPYVVSAANGSIAVHSIGPDGDDDAGSIVYDPTNGIVSDGDIVVGVR